MHQWWMDSGGSNEAIFWVHLQVHTGGMGQECAPKWAKRHPEGTANSMHYTLLKVESAASDADPDPICGQRIMASSSREEPLCGGF